jgi:hypothetical protein
MHFPYKQFLDSGVQLFLPITTGLGFITGLNAISNTDASDQDTFYIFRNIITYTTIGMITGLMFPISIPLISGYTLYMHHQITSISNSRE